MRTNVIFYNSFTWILLRTTLLKHPPIIMCAYNRMTTRRKVIWRLSIIRKLFERGNFGNNEKVKNFLSFLTRFEPVIIKRNIGSKIERDLNNIIHMIRGSNYSPAKTKCLPAIFPSIGTIWKQRYFNWKCLPFGTTDIFNKRARHR